MRKTIAIAISILLVLTICPVALAEGNSETVNHTVTQRVPDSLARLDLYTSPLIMVVFILFC